MSNYYQKGYGGIEMFLCAAVIGLVMYFYFYPPEFNKTIPQDLTGGSNYCRDIITNEDAPTIVGPRTKRVYKLLKENVPILANQYQNSKHNHYGSTDQYQDPKTEKKYVIRNLGDGGSGTSYSFASDLDPSRPYELAFAEYGLIFLFAADDNYQPLNSGLRVDLGPSYKNFSDDLYLVDIYKAIDTPPLPDWVLQCQDYPSDLALEASIEIPQGKSINIPLYAGLYYPTQGWSESKAEEQLNWFLPKHTKFLIHNWWTPHCKPAIYLYPEVEQKVNVQVAIPQGSFLYTDPAYPSNGWDVRAKPNGDLQYLEKDWADSKGKINYLQGVFPYMYYEARIADSAIEKPDKGFVKQYSELELFYDGLLPKLGLNKKESQEFKQYWLKSLPKSPYYFIGIVSQDNLNEIEPLTITPQQDTTIRISLYFEALSDFKVVTPPGINTPERNGFTVVEWGGMLKRDKDHPFTCVE